MSCGYEHVGYCDTCKHFHFQSGSDGPFSDLVECDMWGTEEWKKWEDIFPDMEQAGVTFECPLWKPNCPELKYCTKHRLWYDETTNCPRCVAEELSSRGGVIL